MHGFFDFARLLGLAGQLQLLENFYEIDFDSYDRLFVGELRRLASKTEDVHVKKELRGLEKFQFTRYVLSAVYNSGVRDRKEAMERTHDAVSTLLLGRLFDVDPTSQPILPRFKVSVANLIKNQIAKASARKRNLPSVSIGSEPGEISAGELADRPQRGDESMIDEFRTIVLGRLGDLAAAVLDFRLSGEETKSLVGSPELDFPSAYAIKKAVQQIKRLAAQVAAERSDDELLRQVERALAAEKKTVTKRFEKKDTASVSEQINTTPITSYFVPFFRSP